MTIAIYLFVSILSGYAASVLTHAYVNKKKNLKDLSFWVTKKDAKAQKGFHPFVYTLISASIMLCFYFFRSTELSWIDQAIFAVTFMILVTLSMIDLHTFDIPPYYNWSLLGLAFIHMGFHYTNWLSYVIGFFAVGLPLAGLFYATKGAAIGGGDVKLMAVCGLLLGWQHILLAFVIGCILGSVIHLIRMRISKVDTTLAMGPYLSLGIIIMIIWGNTILDWYKYTVIGL